MLEARVIEPAQSQWASPVLLVWKRDGSLQVCVAYRKLNAVTVKDSYPFFEWTSLSTHQEVPSGLPSLTALAVTGRLPYPQMIEKRPHSSAMLALIAIAECPSGDERAGNIPKDARYHPLAI